MIQMCRRHATERRRPTIVQQSFGEADDLHAKLDVFLTDKMSVDMMTSRQTSPKLSERQIDGSVGCGTQRPSKLRKINSSSNWGGQAQQRMVNRPKTLVNFSMKKNELMSTHIISNIRNILKSIESRQDISSTSVGINSRFVAKQYNQRKSDTTNRRLMCRVLDSSLGHTQNMTLTNGNEKSQTPVLNRNTSVLNRVSPFIPIIDEKSLLRQPIVPGKSITLSAVSNSLDKENKLWQNRKMKLTIRGHNKENANHTSTALVPTETRPSIVADGLAGVCKSAVRGRQSVVSHRHDGSRQSIEAGNAAGRHASRQGHNKFMIRSNTMAIDR